MSSANDGGTTQPAPNEYQEFYLTQRPADHFQTSAQIGGPFTRAIFAILSALDAALQHPQTLTVVDIGAGEAELLTDLLSLATADGLSDRLELIAVDLRKRPANLPAQVQWRQQTAQSFDEVFEGLMLCTELFDDIPTGPYELAHQLAQCIRKGQLLIVDYPRMADEQPTAFQHGRQVAATGTDRNVTNHVDFEVLSQILQPIGSVARMTQAKAIESLAPSPDLTGIAALESRNKHQILTDPNTLGSHTWLLLTTGVS